MLSNVSIWATVEMLSVSLVMIPVSSAATEVARLLVILSRPPLDTIAVIANCLNCKHAGLLNSSLQTITRTGSVHMKKYMRVWGKKCIHIVEKRTEDGKKGIASLWEEVRIFFRKVQ